MFQMRQLELLDSEPVRASGQESARWGAHAGAWQWSVRLPPEEARESSRVGGRCRFLDMKLGPNWKMVGDLQRLLPSQMECRFQIDDSPPARIFRRAVAIEEQVVVHLGVPGVGGRSMYGPSDARYLSQAAELLVARIQIAQQNNVVFVAAGPLHDLEDVRQRVDFCGHFVRIRVSIDQPEGETTTWCCRAGTKASHERLTM